MVTQESHSFLQEGERLDEIGFGGLKLIQKPGEFCYGVDAVLLAGFVQAEKSRRIADLGTGTGVIPLILSHKTKATEIWGIEVQKDSIDRGARSAVINGLEERLHFLHGDVKDIRAYLEAESFDTVVSNPPYKAEASGMQSENRAKMIARHETTAGLEEFMKAAAYLLKNKGSFFLIHRPERLADLCWFGRMSGLEPKEIRLVSTTESSRPTMILMKLVKNGGREMKFLPPLAIYSETGEYSEEVLGYYERA